MLQPPHEPLYEPPHLVHATTGPNARHEGERGSQRGPRRGNLPRAVIFDMDGVLIESEPLWRDGFRYGVAEFMREQGHRAPMLTDADLARFEGGRVDQTLNTLHEHFCGHALADHDRRDLTQRVVAHVSHLFATTPVPIATSVQALRDIAALDIPVAIATSSAPEFLDAVLDTLDLDHLVQVRQSALHLPDGKPHPEVYQRALDALGVTPAEAVAVEDSLTGLESAIRAGLPTVWLTTRPEAEGRTALTERITLLPEPVSSVHLSTYPAVTRNAILRTWATSRARIPLDVPQPLLVALSHR